MVDWDEKIGVDNDYVNGWDKLKALKLHNGRRFAFTLIEQKCYMALCSQKTFPSRKNYGYWAGFIWGEGSFYVGVNNVRRTGQVIITPTFSISQNYDSNCCMDCIWPWVVSAGLK